MKVLATILVLLTSLAGFVLSYEFAYKNIAKFLSGSGEQAQIASVQSR
ncbi:MAG: hypothetical protein HQM09_02815 [Candidatus Riflebacteria bacterium]|nr:hypothetical protein [Candidatus Riflebacteria bacterium]